MPVTAPAWLRRQPSAPSGPPPPPEAIEAFKALVDAEHFPDILKAHKELMKQLNMSPGPFYEFYPKFKAAIRDHLPFRSSMGNLGFHCKINEQRLDLFGA